MKKILLLCCAILPSLLWAQKTSPADKRFAGLDATFTKILDDWKVAGFAVAVVQKDKVIYAQGFGYRDYEKKLPVTPNTLFAIGSVTKAFTASLLGQLQQEGKVALDKPAHQYLPGLSFFNDAMNNSVTLRHMMSHQTGLPRHDISWYLFPTASRDTLLQRVHYQEPTAGVREKWQYNNFMYMAQGVVIEKLTGKSWEENVKEKIFIPLGMTRSNFSVLDLPKSDDASLGYGLRGDSTIRKVPYYNISGMGPAGSINSSVLEMSNWLITWIYGGKFRGKEILPSSFVTEALSPQTLVNAGLPSKEKPDIHFAAYGLGWGMNSYRGHYRVNHGGGIDGFTSVAALFPTDSIGVMVLTNQEGSQVPSIVLNTIADRLLGLKPYDWNGDLKKAADKAKAAQKSAAATKKAIAHTTKPSHALADYSGDYTHPGYGTMTLYTKGDSLFAQTGERQLWLRHNNYDVFDPLPYDPAEGVDSAGLPMQIPIQFRLNVSGEVEGLSVPFEAGLQPIVFKKGAKVARVAKAELEKYVGEYELAGATVKVYTKGETLYVFVPGQPEYELVPNDKDKFALKVASGYFVQFASNGKGEVTDLTFVQPNGNFKATRKTGP
ncbi:MAG TPA: serine hydrolase [Chitinophagaceae bacterium]